jgi:Skp family chaperone for outer membrane proteins
MEKAGPETVLSMTRSSVSKFAILCAGVALGIVTSSFAQSYDPEIGGANVGVAYMVQQDGSTARVGGKSGTINDAGHAMAMQYGAELPAGSVLYRKNGKLYAVKDQMVGDQMMSARAKEWVN